MTQNSDDLLQRLARALETTAADPGDPLRRLAEALAYDHEQAERDLPVYVTDEMLERPVAQLYPALHRHLQFCPSCAALHRAMLLDLDVEPAQIAVPRPDLSFLPGAYLPRLRRSTLRFAQRIGAILFPESLAAVADIAELVLDELQELGPNLRAVPSTGAAFAFSGGDLPDEIKLLAATWTAARRLGESLSQGEMHGLQQSGAWPEAARQAAAQAAVDLGFDPGLAERFALEFAGMAASDPAAIPIRTAP